MTKGSTEGYPYNLGSYGKVITTTSPEAQIWFDRGLVWAYSFNHKESIVCFKQALVHDPLCVMAYWGLAYSLGPNYNQPWDFLGNDLAAVVENTYRAATKARFLSKKNGSPLEQALSKAISARYQSDKPASMEQYAIQNIAYADAMKEAYENFSDDLDVVTLYADSMISLTPWKLWDQVTGAPNPGTRTMEAKRVLETALQHKDASKHPGLLHMYIHLIEMSPFPELGLRPADHLRDLVPDAGHITHMPSHLDVLVGDYRSAVRANQRAAIADEKYLALKGPFNFYSVYRMHTYHSLIYAAMFAGQKKAAFEAVDRMEATLPKELLSALADYIEVFMSVRAHIMIRFGMWDELIAIAIPSDPELYCMTIAVLHYAKGVAYAASGNVPDAERQRELYRAARARVPDSRLDWPNKCIDILGVASEMLDGEIEYRRGNYTEAFEHLRRSIELDDGLGYSEPWSWMQPTRHAYAALLLEQGHVEDAAAVYQADLGLDSTLIRARQHPNNVWALQGYHECLIRLGRHDEARIIGPQLAIAVAVADVPTMPRVTKPPVKAACLACRTSKTRCDGQHPCGNCSNRKRECSYQPSRRGGPRRGAQYERQRQPTADNSLPSSMSDVANEIEPFLDNMIGLVSPYAGIHNLDLSPDSMSIVDGSQQIWGQLTPHDDSSFDSVPIHDKGSSAVRAYQSEAEIANAYYIYIHPYLPLLPPTVAPQHEDRHTVIRPFDEASQAKKSRMPYWPTSSLTLALSAMLVLIPTAEDTFPMAETSLALRRSYAQLFAQAALTAVETETDDLSPALSTNAFEAESCRARNGLHPQVPTQLHPVLALVVLGIYEYCQRGNVSRMRARGNQAITTAMDISLHRLDSTPTDYSEAQRRAWWMTIWVSYLSSNLHLSPPIVSMNDPRITTPYPKFDVYLEPWPIIMRTQEALFESHKIVQNIERVEETAILSDFGTRIRKLDSNLVSLIGETDRHLLTTFDEEPEASVAQNMWMISRMFIHAARTRLHRFRAFMDIPLFLDKYCDLAAINSVDFPHQTSPKWVTDCEISFPFTEQESSIICLKSSLVLPRRFGIAVSGGADSMALAYLCKQLERSSDVAGAISVTAFVVDHRARPESTVEAQKVAGWLRDMDIRTQILSLDWSEITSTQNQLTSPKSGASSPLPSAFETHARRLRFQALGIACHTFKLETLLLGHHQDDNVETTIWRLSAGANGLGLGGIPEVARIPECHGLFGASESWSTTSIPTKSPTNPHLKVRFDNQKHGFITLPDPNARTDKIYSNLTSNVNMASPGIFVCRPLLSFTKASLLETCHKNNVPYVSDPTNFDPTLTPRNAIRSLRTSNSLPRALESESILSLIRSSRNLLQKSNELSNYLLSSQCRILDFNPKAGSAVIQFLDTSPASMDPQLATLSASRTRQIQTIVLRRITELVSPFPDSHFSLRSYESLVPNVFPGQDESPDASTTSNNQKRTKAFTVAGVLFQRLANEATTPGKSQDPRLGGDNIWLLSRQPFMKNRDPVTQINVSPGGSFTPWVLWDNRYWMRLRLVPLDRDPSERGDQLISLPLTIRPFHKFDIERVRKDAVSSRPRGRTNKDSAAEQKMSGTFEHLKAVLSAEAPAQLRFTLPVISREGIVSKPGKPLGQKVWQQLALPTLDYRLSGHSTKCPSLGEVELVHLRCRWKLKWQWMYKMIDTEALRLMGWPVGKDAEEA
ncbi:tRNA(Ile)-lysidine/2-thiocytidine synthase [Penicillium solitum]|uniref:tRNA(Ile)-lysidine/2-thiocytidine synthase n=1 Tax=Penicillium solitum TaxID=60172 RepID=UPI0032C4359C|nr:tRNA(Ile)-lysidine/2-thiocytidine synthase [Penicillium solitum]